MAKTEKATLAVATIGNTVTDALTALKEELKGLRIITETQYKTGSDGKVDGFPNTIQNEGSIETLVKMHSSIYGRSEAYNKSQARLSDLVGSGFAAPIFKINGASFESLESDIVLRIQVLSVTERKKLLEDLVKEAEQFLTEKDKFKMFQGRLASMLGIQIPSSEGSVQE